EGINTTVGAGLTSAHIMGNSGEAKLENSWHLAAGAFGVTGNGIAAFISGTTSGSVGVGDACFMGTVSMNANCNTCDFAEMFESVDSEPIDVGLFVTLVDNKIKVATSEDDYILGITSATPGLLGGNAGLHWQGQYVTDEWGRRVYEDVVVPDQWDEKNNTIQPQHIKKQLVMDPAYDPSQEYKPRAERAEWSAVGLVGQVRVRDDGSCVTNGYCLPNDSGMATVSEYGYRVLQRTGENQVLILLNGDQYVQQRKMKIKMQQLQEENQEIKQ
ncbi:peptidase G2 autoproteolytic cleavage domain-containing protein, partial [Longirhabdus pacifica]|uniref:peptidase G2 autoproteolytic cleavage domain-containing protein n=1 Tax=Longirhabdus pacifica TaxID=2305227 RepID=UPI0023EA5AEA